MVDSLIKGFKDFKKNYYERDKETILNLVKNGQKPKILVIACSDSRVDPAILFQAKPGEIFTIRNVANLVPEYNPDGGLHGVSSAIEYAVRDLKVENIIILGHAHCGGIAALCDTFIKDKSKIETEETKREFISDWVNIAANIKNNINLHDSIESLQHIAERESIKNSIKNLYTFPWVLKSIRENKLNIFGWWFDLENGEILSYDDKNDKFFNISKKDD
ncbi:MAG: carbonic anhydrase [Pelagibacterales bacterium]|nr:carbonic anhydrase [Pelagibacterales bacterium]PPR15678.1 MAG: Carbonic anhydrase 1 [Alphaproteobacteria bacterium MarineAlpha9_Bin3]|tara:strand:- start:1226 stop:1882 length:657 start_codon:yes stop_codon:yes gene_type:complete